jgi:predicted nucleic acid-binding Zn ribbon protein
MQEIEKLLQNLIQQPAWQNYRQFCSVVDCWQKTVGEKISKNSCPIGISRGVLWIATPNSVWAQTLTMQRYVLLKKINSQLSEPLTDLRFSSAQWHKNLNFDRNTISNNGSANKQKHPSQIEVDLDRVKPEETPLENTPKEAFQRWAKINKMRSQNLPLCPHCNCPTPPGEIYRWNCCYLCVAQKWSRKTTANPEN